MAVASQLVQRRMYVHIIPNIGADRLVAAVSCVWTDLEREPVRLATTKILGICTRYFNPNDFKYSLAATSALAGFQS